MHPLEALLHRLHWVLITKTEARAGDQEGLFGGVGLEEEGKWYWWPSTPGGGTESSLRRSTSETQGQRAFLRSKLGRTQHMHLA